MSDQSQMYYPVSQGDTAAHACLDVWDCSLWFQTGKMAVSSVSWVEGHEVLGYFPGSKPRQSGYLLRDQVY